jgi:hypothetical protein
MVVEDQHSAKTFAAFDWSCAACSCWHRFDRTIVQALMVSFCVIMIDILGNGLPKMPLAKTHDLAQAFSHSLLATAAPIWQRGSGWVSLGELR